LSAFAPIHLRVRALLKGGDCASASTHNSTGLRKFLDTLAHPRLGGGQLTHTFQSSEVGWSWMHACKQHAWPLSQTLGHWQKAPLSLSHQATRSCSMCASVAAERITETLGPGRCSCHPPSGLPRTAAQPPASARQSVHDSQDAPTGCKSSAQALKSEHPRAAVVQARNLDAVTARARAAHLAHVRVVLLGDLLALPFLAAE
jgi:hypothetical protein